MSSLEYRRKKYPVYYKHARTLWNRVYQTYGNDLSKLCEDCKRYFTCSLRDDPIRQVKCVKRRLHLYFLKGYQTFNLPESIPTLDELVKRLREAKLRSLMFRYMLQCKRYSQTTLDSYIQHNVTDKNEVVYSVL